MKNILNHKFLRDSIAEEPIDFIAAMIKQPLLKQSKSSKGIVYLINDGEFTKIGFSKTGADKRLRQLQTANPRKLTLVFEKQCDFPFEYEQDLHLVFSSKRAEGEWFRLSKQDLFNISIDKYYDFEKYIKSLLDTRIEIAKNIQLVAEAKDMAYKLLKRSSSHSPEYGFAESLLTLNRKIKSTHSKEIIEKYFNIRLKALELTIDEMNKVFLHDKYLLKKVEDCLKIIDLEYDNLVNTELSLNDILQTEIFEQKR